MQEEKQRCRRYIRIENEEHWKMIDEIMKVEGYQKSFNKVIIEALDFGLPLLHQFLYPLSDNKEEQISNYNTTMQDEMFMQIIRLLKEMIVNETINKSILCSLFQAKSLELNHHVVSGKKFEEGSFRDTPDYLIEYELKALQKIRR